MLRIVLRIGMLVMAVLIASLCNCSSEDEKSTPTVPTGLSLACEDAVLWLGEETQVSAAYAYRNEDAPDCAWFVDGVLGGNAELGNITQDNPAVYTAPFAAPPSGSVTITAQSVDDETLDGALSLEIATQGLELAIADAELWVGESTQVEASFTYDRVDAPACQWYVNGELGGSEANGFITQDNPATYTAPVPPPGPGQVSISAAWEQNPAVSATGTVAVLIPAVQISLPAEAVQVAGSLELDAMLVEAPREDPSFEWYVDNIFGGDASVGTITQTTPAIYTAPHDVPQDGAVTIKARWLVAPEHYHASVDLNVRFTVKHVNAVTGEDDPDGGRIDAPYKTITYALQRVHDTAIHGDTILVAPGTYGPALGEQFPKTVKWETTLRGADPDACIIEADPTETNMFYMYSNCVIEDITFSNPNYETSSANIAIFIQGSSTVRNVRVVDPFNYSAIRVGNPNVVGTIVNCVLDASSFPDQERGIELLSPARAIIRDCQFTGWGRAIMCSGTDEATHLIENCTFSDNVHAVMVYGAESRADLGGGAEGSLGGNTFLNNEIGVYSQTVYDIYALYNNWSEIPPIECATELDAPCDYYANNTGQIIWE